MRALHLLRDEAGQAVVEYAVALSLLVLVIVFVGSFVRSSAESSTGGLHAQTFIRAPYTISTSVGSSGQCVKDLLLH